MTGVGPVGAFEQEPTVLSCPSLQDSLIRKYKSSIVRPVGDMVRLPGRISSLVYLILLVIYFSEIPQHVQAQDDTPYRSVGVISAVYLPQGRIVISDISYRIRFSTPLFRCITNCKKVDQNLLRPGMRVGFNSDSTQLWQAPMVTKIFILPSQ